MSKLLFWVFVIAVALLIARIAARSAVKNRQRRTRAASPSEPMAQCAHCGVHLPASQAVRRKGFNYCGLAHSLRGPGR